MDEPDDANGPDEAPHSQLIILLAAFGDVAFTGAVAVHVAFSDVAIWPAVLIACATVAFVVATVVGLVTRRRGVAMVAAGVVALAGVAAVVVAVDAGRRYDALRHEGFGDRAGPRLVEPDSAHGRSMGAAMLSSIISSLAAITALPLPAYLAYRAARSRPAPPPPTQ